MEISKKLLELRRQARMTQVQTSKQLASRGLGGTQHAISKWESGQTTPDAMHFLALCEIYEVDDIAATFLGPNHRRKDPFSQLNAVGRQRAMEYISLLAADERFARQKVVQMPQRGVRTLALYDMPVSAGTGQFLDSTEYEMIEVDDSIPAEANFAVRVSGDSMTPRFVDGQVVYVHLQPSVEDGEYGIFLVDGNVYLKKLALTPKPHLVSLNSKYPPIDISAFDDLRVIGHVVL